MHTLLFRSFGSIRFLMFFLVFKEIPYVHQGCIYFIKNTEKNINIVKYYCILKYKFSILLYFKIFFIPVIQS